jgi:N-acetylglutamate synthase
VATRVPIPNPLLRELEQTVVGAWPASETLELGGWALRASGGPTHRGNSVATLDATGNISLDDRIEQAEAWYRERERPAQFQIGPCAAPAGLDAALSARGYRKGGEALCAIVPALGVIERMGSGLVARVESSPNEAWLEMATRSSRFASSHQVFLGFLARLGPRARFVTAYAERGDAAAIGLGIRSGQRLGIYAMLTLPEQRRRGAALAALTALAESALADGIPELYLLVERENTAARNLYARLGFQDLYHYHYRVPERTPAKG